MAGMKGPRVAGVLRNRGNRRSFRRFFFYKKQKNKIDYIKMRAAVYFYIWDVTYFKFSEKEG